MKGSRWRWGLLLPLMFWATVSAAQAGQPELLDGDCVKCHQAVVEGIRKDGGAHIRDVGCGECHQGHLRRGEAITAGCTLCHEPHGDDGNTAGCQGCHPPHAPLLLSFGEEVADASCAPCHGGEVESLTHAGLGHGKLGCRGCHPGHTSPACRSCHAETPPGGRIPPLSCVGCHLPSGKPHFTAEGCEACHPPHTPGDLQLAGGDPVAPVCIGCHDQVGRRFAGKKDGHAVQDCNVCHPSHGEALACLDCHQGHGEGSEAGECSVCHAPHAPTFIVISEKVPGALCASCHDAEVDAMTSRGGGHGRDLACGSCHKRHDGGGDGPVPCGKCHIPSKRSHFRVGECALCHPPHSPAEIDLSRASRSSPACLSCHGEVDRFMRLAPSRHAKIDCRRCHESHGEARGCLSCHKSHGATVTAEDCTLCHRPHTPSVVEWEKGVRAPLCSPCHQGEVQRLSKQGGAHATGPGCTGCHPAHPPEEKTVQPCAKCHPPKKKQHFQVQGCGACHPPHAPLEISFSIGAPVASTCQGCHPGPALAMKGAPSAHGRQDCSSCHPAHYRSEGCLGCHSSHDASMNEGDCKGCHPHHTPNRIRPAEGTPQAFCILCHSGAGEELGAGGTPHGELACTGCHRGSHGETLTCSGCHGAPHDPGLHRKYPGCGECHGTAHALLPWGG